MNYTPKMQVELFHLMFLRQFSSLIEAKFYAIKGGCNLRFFFNSVRYSEDLDLDIQTIQKQTLEKKVNKILTSPALLKSLQGYGFTQLTMSAPKQTQTTQRWKVQLYVQHVTFPLNTKIEFSRREGEFDAELTDIAMTLCQQYRLPPTRFSHYGLDRVIEQKILALAYRSLTQARDIFDLYHLLHMGKQFPLVLDKKHLEQAKEALLSVSFGEYKAQVVSFLEPEHQAHFDSESYWDSMTTSVFTYLEAMYESS